MKYCLLKLSSKACFSLVILPVFSSIAHLTIHADLYLYVQYMCGSEAAVLEQSVKLVGEDERVQTERVPAER